MPNDRRRFARFDLPQNTLAFDEAGRELGRIERAGGGGLQIRTQNNGEELQPGHRFSLTVSSPAGARHTIPVEVRFRDGNLVGVQFLSRDLAGVMSALG